MCIIQIHMHLYIFWEHEKVRSMYLTWYKWSFIIIYFNKQNSLYKAELVWLIVVEIRLLCLSHFQRHWRHPSSVGCDSHDHGAGSDGFYFTWFPAETLPRTLSPHPHHPHPQPYASVCLYCCWSQTLTCFINFWMNLQNVNSKINEHGLTLSLSSLCLCA